MKDKKIFRKRHFIFIFISLFFYIFMIILFWNLSFIMFKNSGIFIAKNESKILKSIIESNVLLNNSDKLNYSIINLLSIFVNNRYILSLRVYDKNGKILYNYGNFFKFKKNLSYSDLKKMEFLYNIENDLYNIVFLLNRESIYVDIVYDLSYISKNYFQNKREIFIVVSLLNFMILFFLSIMILNLQRRLYLKEQQLIELKTTDDETGLLSKEHFLKLFKKEVERVQRSNNNMLAILIIDIDNFLNISSIYKDEFSSIVLQTVSKIIINNFRNFDIIGRFGSDEFVVLMLDSNEDLAFDAAERCRIAIEENKFYYEGKNEITITVSIGVADYKKSSEDSKVHPVEQGPNFFRKILFNSLNALSRAKRDGRNRVVKYSQL